MATRSPLEDEIFRHLGDQALDALLAKAETIVGAELMNAHIQTKSQGRMTLHDIKAERLIQGYLPATRELLGAASRIRNSGWFKSLTTYQEVARTSSARLYRTPTRASWQSRISSGRLQVPLEIDLFAIERGSITAPQVVENAIDCRDAHRA